ncbi:MAG TPA: ATP-binding cassette domain-containing protein [Limnobacter sp.]|nr:ATP-binding cassette domain-containing protein [Limnobacter sp.]
MLENMGIEFLPSQWRVQEALLQSEGQYELELLQAYLTASRIAHTTFRNVLPAEVQHLGPHCLAMDNAGQVGILSEFQDRQQAFQWVLQIEGLTSRPRPEAISSTTSGLIDFWRRLRNSAWLREAFQFEKGSFRPVVLASLLINLLAIAGPLFSLQVYDRIIPNQAYFSLAALLAGVAMCLGFEHMLKHARHRLMELAATSIDTRCTSRLSRQMLNVRTYQTEPAVLLQHLRAFEQLRELVTGVVLLAVIDLPFLVLFIAVITIIHPLFLMISGGLVLATLILVAASHRRLSLAGLNQMKQSRESQAQWLDSLACMDNIQAHGVEKAHAAKLDRLQLQTRLSGNQVREQVFMISQRIHLLQQAGWLATLVTGVYLVIEKQLTVGGLIAVSMLTMRCFAPIQKLQGHLVHTHSAQASFEELDRFLDEGNHKTRGDSALATIQHLELRNVEVRKPGSGLKRLLDSDCMLQRIQLELPAGSRTGIIGPTGSGKTSLLKLLAGQLQHSQGHVLLNRLAIEHYHPEEFSSRVGYAAQPPLLIKGTLLDNIRFMRPQVDVASCREIIEKLGLKPWVESHPDGLYMPIENQGCNLSSGQKQAVSLCRALVGKPSLLLLDEPTVCLDQAIENRLIELLQKLDQETILVFTTHKLGLLACADSLVLMHQGRIHSQGEKAQVLHQANSLAKAIEHENRRVA